MASKSKVNHLSIRYLDLLLRQGKLELMISQNPTPTPIPTPEGDIPTPSTISVFGNMPTTAPRKVTRRRRWWRRVYFDVNHLKY